MSRIDIIIPVLNEEAFIRPCLGSVLAFHLEPGTTTTVYVVDGGSSDQTKDIALEMAVRFSAIRVLDNPGRIQSCALNSVLRCGNGEYVLRLDAHAQYPQDYLSRCLGISNETAADNVGGMVITRPGASGFQAKLVQAISTHWFGVGNSPFRLRGKAGPADTVPYGFFRKTIFEKIGYFDERLVRAQDYEFNRRIIASGGTVWLDPEIKIFYHNMPDLGSFYRKQLFKEGCYNSYLWYLAPYAFAFRHCVSGLFATGILGGCLGAILTSSIALPFVVVLALYFGLATFASLQQARRYHSVALALVLPLGFFLFHFFHGLGVLRGLLKLASGNSPVQRVREPWPGAKRFRAWPLSSTA